MTHRRARFRRVSAGAGTSLLLLIAACSEITPPPTPSARAHAPAPTGVSPVISPNIDLDQPDLLLHYKTMDGNIVDIIPPWGSGAPTTAWDNVRFDHATSDGWVVVYNTFDVNQTNDRPKLVLYNKYRGILRWWWYNDVQPSGPSNYLTYALMIDGNNTSLMNFVGEFAKDYNTRSSHPFAVKAVNGQFNQGLIKGAWYYFDTEMAYDPSIAGAPQTSYSLAVNGWATSVAKLQLDGDINGTINGTITGSGSNALLNNLNIAVTGATSAVTILDNGSKAQSSLSNTTNSGLSATLSTAIKNALSQLASTGLRLAGSQLEHVFGSLISTGASPTQKVDLSLTARMSLSGTMTTDGSAIFFKGALPGTARGDPSGYLPYYNDPMGVFNVAAPPVVRWKSINLYPPAPPGQKYIQYMADIPQIIVNPAVASEVTVGLPVVTVLYLKQYSGMEPLGYNPNYLASGALSKWSLVNNVYGNEWYAASAPYALLYSYWSGTPDPNVVVQVTVTVTPKNGSSPIDVVRMYRPNIIPG